MPANIKSLFYSHLCHINLYIIETAILEKCSIFLIGKICKDELFLMTVKLMK